MEVVGAGLLMVGLTVAMFGGFGALVYYSAQGEKKRVAIWRELAARVGGRFVEPEGGLFARKPCSILVERDDVLALLDTYVVSSGKSSTVYTRCRADYVLGVGPAFRVYREGVLSTLGKALGTQDVTIGIDPAFDEHFMVKADDEAKVLADALSASVQRRLLAAHPKSWLQSDGKTITLTWYGLERDADKLHAALELVSEAARFGVGWLEVVRAVPDARSLPAHGAFGARQPPSFVLDRGGGEVHIFPALHNTTPVLRVHAEAPDLQSASVRVSLAGGRLDPSSLPEGMRSASTLEAVTMLGDARIGAEPGEVWIDLHGSCGPERIDAAARAVSSIASGAGAPFR
ncbi:MAG: hypothetical protein IT379_07980 [Deltaproteobacteria bacterium]|nr:hypothetical protein [Deltaproteobacteria bacterium]